MDNELVEQITAEVLRQLENQGYPNQAHQKSIYQALTIFTGGTIGLEASLAQLKSIQADNVKLMTVVLSAAAERIIGVTRIKEILGAAVQVHTSRSSYPGKELREADIVLMPVLTQNTAAKLAYTLADSLVPTLVLQALMLGKTVVAAVNAADPYDKERRQKGMCKQPALLAVLAENLHKIQNYGIRLVRAEDLAAEVHGVLFRPQKPAGLDKALQKKVLDAGTVRNAVLAGEKTIIIEENAIITPLALDVARELKADIIRRMDL
ncbi:flavoprotein [Sporomusa acidovorans]|uniref:Flavoprotein n=1 Tax=Sporomusa acidovorans (strain ATCC 49682 / DSM 3132 / Mol) TaxID=1123286 RepID=A0ABZ3J9T0_SPOA4|nr:flavoprotein [Sporomusa acidovorans]OZC17336.1 flavoprotein [Sporomusa acidovorans DSM 3132]SDF45447.1 hypothetical protein SAMN04488499_105012 [Sporomusa acidovorans]